MRFRHFIASSAAVLALGSAIFLYSSHPSSGSDHQDSPAVLAQPGADITDVFVFPSPRDANKVILAMDVIPLIPAGLSGAYSLDPHVLYQFKMSHVAGAPADLDFRIQAHGKGYQQQIAFYASAQQQKYGANDLNWHGDLGQYLGSARYNDVKGTRLQDGITAFVGPRADPFFFDLFQFFKILPDRDYANARTGDMLGTSMPSFNGFAKGKVSGAASNNYACSTAPSTNALTQINGGFDVVTILLEVPRSLLATKKQSPVLHLWTTASSETQSWYGIQYHQIELLSRPAVKELFETFSDHAITNAAEPYNDPEIKNSISYFMNNVAGRSPAISNVVTSVLYPNEMAFDVSQPGSAAYLGVETGGATGSKFGGRALTDDVITTSLGVVFGKTVPALGLAPEDQKENKCLIDQHVTSGQGGTQTQTEFPFFAQPH